MMMSSSLLKKVFFLNHPDLTQRCKCVLFYEFITLMWYMYIIDTFSCISIRSV